MTDTQELLEQSFEINLNNYGPEDVERLNDWAINAYAALEALQAEVKHLNLHLKATQSGRDAALARLSKIERQEPVAEMTLVDMGIGDARQLRVNWLMDGYLDVGAKLYAAAGAPPVEPSQAQPPAPSDTAITYMTGYSDGREWAQPSQAAELDYEKKLDIVSNWFSDEGMQSRAMQMLGDIEQAIAAAPTFIIYEK